MCSSNGTFIGRSIFSTDFGSGFTQFLNATPSTFGFSINYTQRFTAAVYEGQFTFANRVPTLGHWHTGALDHTANQINSYMLLINGDLTHREFYHRTVNHLCVGLRYEFSAYLANIDQSVAEVPPNVRFEVRSATPEQSLIAELITGPIAAVTPMIWIRFSLSFLTPCSSIILLIVPNTVGWPGNDVGIDDIVFGVCSNATSGICV